jgi:outer membrane protein OmpA-like peptidoglycan-associated protein
LTVSASPPLESRPASGDTALDRKALAGLLLQIARNLQPQLRGEQNGFSPGDLRLEQLRTLLLGREIEVLSRLTELVEDPERFATAVGRVLPSAISQARRDARLGEVLAPAMEKATESSIRSNPRVLVDILYPTIVPAIRKSIGEMIDQTFQSLNESLKFSLTWRGLKWRWEAWRTGVSFADVVLRHTLVYRVEHLFLIHRHTGLLICHVAAENAASQDPQLVSSMLVAIQDFVKDSFSGVEHQGVDALRLGELRLWSEPGPFAMLVAVIRGDPPESLHETFANTLSRIHAERHRALENFDGDSSGFGDIEAALRECLALQQEAPPRVSFGRLILTAWLVLVVLFAAAWAFRWWSNQQLWKSYVARLETQPGILVTESGTRDGKFVLAGLRDPLAVDPAVVMRQVGIDPDWVVAHWAPYEALDPQMVIKRLRSSLDPPPTVMLSIEGTRIMARGAAPASWIERARIAAAALPAGAPVFDLAGIRNVDRVKQRLWHDYLNQLREEHGIVITNAQERDGKFELSGLRDPLAVDPVAVLRQVGLDPDLVTARWAPYQSLDPPFVLKRLQWSLDPPPTVSFTLDGNRIAAHGAASLPWLKRAQIAASMLPAGAPNFDLSAVRDISHGPIAKLRQAIQSHIILFENNVALPAPGQDASLDELTAELKELTELSANLRITTRVTLTGNADNVGGGTFNLSLSVARAEAVRALLQKRGVDPNLLAVRGAGSLEPVASEISDTGRAANRRVSFTVDIVE